MEHSYIEQHDVLWQYLRRRLPEEQARQFEAHFIDCPLCLENLEVEDGMRRGLHTVRALSTSVVGRGAPQAGRAMRSLAAAAVVVVAAASSAGYIQTWRALQASRQRVSVLEREAQAGVSALEKRETTVPPTPLKQAGELPAQVAVFELEQTRSADASSPSIVTLPESSTLVVFTLPIGSTSGSSRLQATLEDEGGSTVWRKDDVQAASPVVGVAVPRSLLPAGSYRIVLTGIIQGRPAFLIARYAFRVRSR